MTSAGVLDDTTTGSASIDVDVAALSDDELVAWSRLIEVDRRRAEARQAEAMREVERRQLFCSDGHRDARAWGRATHRWSSVEANAMRRLGRLTAASPQVADALRDSHLGIGQAHVIAKALANPRCTDQLLAQIPQLLAHAQHESAARFERLVHDWIELIDQDGGFDARERAHDDRGMSFAASDHGFSLRLLGTAIDGEELRAAFAQYLDAEWQAEWADCVAEHGDQACPARMARSATQRRYDAFMRMIRDAVSHITGSGSPEALVNLMIDVATFEAVVGNLFQPDDDVPAQPVARPDDLRRWCSQTTDGTFIPPLDIVLEALRGQIRLVVTDQRGVVLHMGHRKRLFTGAMRDAVMLAATRCTHPGCDVASGSSQADHLQPHIDGGTTSITNGGPSCGKHNRWRYLARSTTVLDADGYWHTYRADGTEVG